MQTIIKNVFCLIISSLFLHGAIANAEITIVSGSNQILKLGMPSEQIIVKVTNSAGSPEAGVQVDFSLTNPEGYSDNERLIVKTGNTNSLGEIDTIMNPAEIMGTHTLTATVANDSSQTVSTEIQVTVGDVFSLSVVEGSNQKITKGKFSDNILFQIKDSFGNLIEGEPVEFKLENPNGEIVSNGLTVSSDISDEDALVSTRVNNILTQEGIYTILVSFPQKNVDSTNIDSATIIVLPSLPDLPTLGFGSVININGMSWVFLNSTARFYGGISVNGSPFTQEVVKKANNEDEIVVHVAITTDDNHIDEYYDILVVIGYTEYPFSTEEEEFYVVLDNAGTVQPWKLIDRDNLLAFQTDVALFRNPSIEIFRGKLDFTGLIRAFFGYRLSDGTIVFNSELALSLLLEE